GAGPGSSGRSLGRGRPSTSPTGAPRRGRPQPVWSCSPPPLAQFGLALLEHRLGEAVVQLGVAGDGDHGGPQPVEGVVAALPFDGPSHLLASGFVPDPPDHVPPFHQTSLSRIDRVCLGRTRRTWAGRLGRAGVRGGSAPFSSPRRTAPRAGQRPQRWPAGTGPRRPLVAEAVGDQPAHS